MADAAICWTVTKSGCYIAGAISVSLRHDLDSGVGSALTSLFRQKYDGSFLSKNPCGGREPGISLPSDRKLRLPVTTLVTT